MSGITGAMQHLGWRMSCKTNERCAADQTQPEVVLRIVIAEIRRAIVMIDEHASAEPLRPQLQAALSVALAELAERCPVSVTGQQELALMVPHGSA